MKRAVDVFTLAFVWLLLGALVALSIRGLSDPASAAVSFGVPLESSAASIYQGVYRSRNLMIAVTGILFLLLGMRRALAVLTTAAISLPVFDIAILLQDGRGVTLVHPATLVALVLASALLWVRARGDAASA